MSNDYDDQEEKLDSFEIDDAGEATGYISLDQARVLAMRSARTEPGEYGRFTRSPMAFEVVEEEETEDHYVVTLAFRPQGEYSGGSGREQFFIEKEGGVAHRQVLDLPRPTQTRRKFPIALVGGILIVVAAVVAVVAVVAGGALGESNESDPVLELPPVATQPPVQAQTFPTPTSALPRSSTNSPPTPVPEPTVRPTPTIRLTGPVIVQTNAQPAIAEPTPRTAPVIQSQEPAFELTRAEIPQFGFSFEYPSTWEVVNESEGEFFAAAQNGAIAVLAEGQEFDGTLEQLAEDFLTTLDSFLNAFEVVNRSERVLRLGNVETGDRVRGILVEFRYRDEDGRPSIGRAFLGTRVVGSVRMAILIKYTSVVVRSDIAQKLFTLALDSLELFPPEIAQEANGPQVFTGQVYSEWTDTSAYAEVEFEVVDGRLVGYIDIEPPHLGSGDFEGDIDGNQVSFLVNFYEGDIEFNCIYDGTFFDDFNGASGDYMCSSPAVGVVDQGSWEVFR